MSAIGATTAPLRRSRAAAPLPAPRQPHDPAAARPAARLSLVASRPAPAGRTPFAVLVGGLLLTGLMALLLVHTLAAQDAFRVHALNQRLAGLRDTEQQLAVANAQSVSPTALRTRAEALGMRPSQIEGYRHAKGGRVIGTLVAVPTPVIATAPSVPTTPAHKPGQRAGTKPAAGTKATATAKATTPPAATSKPATKSATGHAAHHGGGHTGASAH